MDLRQHNTSLVAQTVKCLSTMRETWVRSLGLEDPLEKAMETHPSILAWRIPWTEEPGRLQSMGSQRIAQDWVTKAQSREYPDPETIQTFPILQRGKGDPASVGRQANLSQGPCILTVPSECGKNPLGCWHIELVARLTFTRKKLVLATCVLAAQNG